ncbi:hypothetical protein Emag_002244 [Eimeria magna]
MSSGPAVAAASSATAAALAQQLTTVCPLDVVKCKMQVYPERYTGLMPGVRTVLKEEGASGLRLGWAPTLIGYSMQGMFKFGLYEYFKDFYGNLMGERGYAANKGAVWLAASASAELFADIALCPMEMVKVKIQTSPQGAWPTGLFSATRQMMLMKHDTKFPFGSVVPLWSHNDALAAAAAAAAFAAAAAAAILEAGAGATTLAAALAAAATFAVAAAFFAAKTLAAAVASHADALVVALAAPVASARLAAAAAAFAAAASASPVVAVTVASLAAIGVAAC